MGVPPDQPPRGPLSAARTVALAASLVLLLTVVSLAARSGDHDRAVPGGGVATTTGHHVLFWALLVHRPDRRGARARVLLLRAAGSTTRPRADRHSSPGPPPADCDRDRRHLGLRLHGSHGPQSTRLPARQQPIREPARERHRQGPRAACRPQRRARDPRLRHRGPDMASAGRGGRRRLPPDANAARRGGGSRGRGRVRGRAARPGPRAAPRRGRIPGAR